MSTSTTKFYETLGVAKGASDADLKKAYRKLAMKWHPDRCDAPNAKEKFQEISYAYETLSDPEKRKIYDMYGEAGLKGGAPGGPGGNFSSGGSQQFSQEQAQRIFEQFFGGFGTGKQQQQQRGGPGRTQFTFGGPSSGTTFFNMGGMDTQDDEDDAFGGMNGFASMFGAGNGRRQRHQQPQQHPGGFFPGSYQQNQFKRARQQTPQPQVIQKTFTVSLEDLASGFSKKMKVSRKVQDPQTMETRSEANILTIEGRPGVKAGTKYTFSDAGDQIIGQPRQDIQFVLAEKPHMHFKRSGDDLETTVNVPLVDALCGGQFQVPLLDGRFTTVTMEKVEPNATAIITGEGMPKKRGGRGDIVVKFNVVFPKGRLSAAQKEGLKNFLPRS